MTTREVTEQFAITWAGGPLLPPREGGSSLTDAARPRGQTSANPMIRVRPRHGGGKPRKHDEDTRQAARALWQRGIKLHVIAERLNIPKGTVWGWVGGRERT